jgi:hypothetical protein
MAQIMKLTRKEQEQVGQAIDFLRQAANDLLRVKQNKATRDRITMALNSIHEVYEHIDPIRNAFDFDGRRKVEVVEAELVEDDDDQAPRPRPRRALPQKALPYHPQQPGLFIQGGRP